MLSLSEIKKKISVTDYKIGLIEAIREESKRIMSGEGRWKNESLEARKGAQMALSAMIDMMKEVK